MVSNYGFDLYLMTSDVEHLFICWPLYIFFREMSVKSFAHFYLFIYLLFLAAPGLSCGTQDLRCGMRTISCGMHVGSSSPTRDRTQAPCIGSVESYPQDHQGSPLPIFKLGCLGFLFVCFLCGVLRVLHIFWILIPYRT